MALVTWLSRVGAWARSEVGGGWMADERAGRGWDGDGDGDGDEPRGRADAREGVEYDGAVVRMGFETVSAGACARACAETRGCNVWVRARDAEAGACWLKRVERASDRPRVMSEGVRCAWTSGRIDKDYAREAREILKESDAAASADAVTLTVAGFGDVALTLEPTWHEPSVEFLRALASNANSCDGSCEIYRVEPGFLVQGTLRSYDVASNSATEPGPRLMERGDVGWAGEGPGPDWFVYLGARPAAHFGTRHTVFARVADEASFSVLERVVSAPSSTPGGPNTMRFIDQRPKLQVRFKTRIAPS
ncbi:Cyclophilin-like peptidyl-prolyl cis-trans isomerase domain [Ostreococcus tauri]|uniref:Cyclophilin-like peptidyl-prolyl cis-trans isomerase domain n=1 Tax=Ostreococcus tauri TaxID=70448 RepID=A0A090MCI5_OSTTA|nr:Cyclophilin-like peptidyl-prolyl cis-trans isomerase domain [Ostreococcus tauri]CEG01405.1 Cyclophilin-like peptidyl-prolyl cis-trans isomerase domain [Ostreococcus tauri]|eukprot:XP_022840938.1 Cyclophilin-like peptidyl-prolyl cis-trans isomerase domain [Ostreococcus tauri]